MVTFITKIFSLLLCFIMININFPVTLPGCGKADTDVIADNITDGLLNGTLGAFAGPDVYDGDTILSLLAEDENGNLYFADVDYTNGDRTTWPSTRHITRAERLAVLFRQETDEVKKETYKKAVLGLIDYWIAEDPQNSNWWHNKLNVPNILGELGLLMKGELSEKQLLRLSAIVGRGCFIVDPTIYAYTGANTVDLAMSTIKFGALTGSSAAVRAAVRAVSGELKYSAAEGLKKDHTYFQHGNRLYMGGYGITYISAMTNVIAMLSGTEYIFTEAQFDAFTAFILDGLQRMSYGATLDPTTMGRSVSRLNAQPLPSIVSALNKLAAVEEMPRKDELTAYAVSIANDMKNDFGLQYFDDAKFLVINEPGFYFSFRGGSNTLVYAEIVNDENVLGYNSSFPGVTTILSAGREYTDIAPVYDYSFVPGTTAVYETDEQLRAHGDFSYRALPGVYGGTYSDGAAVLSAKTTHEGIDMTVSCFAIDGAAMLLGAGMKDAKGREMNTTLDQCYAVGAPVINGNVIVHNGIKYTVYQGGEISARTEHRTGNWRRNNLTYPDIAAEADIFTLSMKNTGSYAYSVMSEHTDAAFEVIVNTDKVQAVRLPDGRVAAAFYAPARFDHAGKTYSGKAGDAVIF